MVAITKLIMLGIAVVCAVTLAFIILDFVSDKVKSASSKKRNHIKPMATNRNQVKFYVARDKNGELWLYLGKPIREDESCTFRRNKLGNTIINSSCFEHFGLNINDYKDLKWEDEPIEVFVNMED